MCASVCVCKCASDNSTVILYASFCIFRFIHFMGVRVCLCETLCYVCDS